ncbi:MAG: hypothetical protein ACYSUT_10010 [Planctomycetota bacterium]|jgi:hypothetical protein
MVTKVKYSLIIIVIAILGANVSVAAEDTSNTGIQLPKKGSIEYWNLRSEAISEFLPFLTRKRSEIKSNQKLLEDFLLKNGKADDFTAKNVPVPDDPKVYFELLQIGQGLKDMNMPAPKSRPSWDQLMDIVMKHVVFEGFIPTAVEQDELDHYIHICRQKEQYGQKVRKDMRGVLDQCARMWVYLDSIQQLDEFKSYYANLRLESEMQRAQAKAQYHEQYRQAVIQREAGREEQKFQDAQAREEFHSSQKERRYNDHQARMQYRQTLLDERFVNSGVYYHR